MTLVKIKLNCIIITVDVRGPLVIVRVGDVNEQSRQLHRAAHCQRQKTAAP